VKKHLKFRRKSLKEVPPEKPQETPSEESPETAAEPEES